MRPGGARRLCPPGSSSVPHRLLRTMPRATAACRLVAGLFVLAATTVGGGVADSETKKSLELPPTKAACWGPLPAAAEPAPQPTPARPDVTVGCADASDCTAEIQAALDDAGGRRLVFTARVYVTQSLLLRANDTVLEFRPGSTLLAKPGAFVGGADPLLTIQGAHWGQPCNATCFCPAARNVTISGGGATFQMHRSDYTRSPYHPTENRMAIAVQGVAGLRINGLTVTAAGGDGIYLGQVLNRNVTIEHVTLTKSFRNALTVGNIIGLRVLHTVLSLTNGTAPMAGVDFESDECYGRMQDILFTNVSAVGNSGAGFQFTLGPNPLCHPFGGETVITARLEDIRVVGGGKYGVSVSANGPFPPGGQLHMKGLRVSDTLNSGLLVEDKGAGWPVFVEDALFSNVSTPICPTPGGECPNGPIWVEGRNALCEGVTFTNVTLHDDRLRWPVSFIGSGLDLFRIYSGVSFIGSGLPAGAWVSERVSGSGV